MLADLTLAGCYTGYNTTTDQLQRDRILLQSAKQNLARMAYFGLTEQQAVSQYIFEQTFHLDFENPFDQANATLSAQAIAELTPAQVWKIKTYFLKLIIACISKSCKNFKIADRTGSPAQQP
jgi:hypothetical protein